jgi:type II secretory pathway component PulF
MKEFRYKALTPAGQTVTGIRQAETAEELSNELLQQGLVILRASATLGSLGRFLAPRAKVKARDLADFTQHMSTSLGAGIPAVTALSDFQEQATGRLAEILADIRGEVSSGTALDESFGRHADVFSPVYLAMMAAGQRSGKLDESFDEMVAYLEWSESLRSQTTQAMIYPSILFSGIIGLFLLLMLFVIPRFDNIFSSVDFELPALTVAVVGMGRFLGRWWWLLGFAAAMISVALRLVLATPRGAYLRDRMLLSAPVLGRFILKISLSRFAKTFSLIFASGVDLLRALDLMQGVVGNRVMARQLAEIRARVASGESLTEGFRDAPVFPPLIQRLVSVGEATGSLDTSLLRASQHLDREIPRDLKKAFTVFEAVIIAILGVLVCVAALSLLMPIMQIRGGA